MRTAVFSIVSLNYVPFAITLMESLKSVHPEWERHVLLVDRADRTSIVRRDLFITTMVEQLPLPKMREFLFRYGIMEMNTAVKPYMFRHLRKQNYDRIIYLDPDILVIDRLVDVEKLMEAGATAVVMPHLTAPLNDGRYPGELEIMRAGAYNLGFIALNASPASDAFIAWWEKKLEYGAACDPDHGLFTDQKWIDLAPGMFGGFAILRDPGYNVAYWNLPHRSISRNGKAWFANSQPLRFFHFSGFDPLNPEPFSKHQDRYNIHTVGGSARELALQYAEQVLSHGLLEARAKPYTFGVFTNGVSIPASVRALYRKEPDIQKRAGNDPFTNADLFLFGGTKGLPIILYSLWEERPSLQRAFPAPLGSSRVAYYEWFTNTGALELGIDEAFVAPVQRALRAIRSTEAKIGAASSIWARALVFIHKRLAGGKISTVRQREYNDISGPIAFLRLALKQLFRSVHKITLTGLKKGEPVSFRGVQRAAQPRLRKKRRLRGFYAEPGKPVWWIGRKAELSIESAASTKVRVLGINHGELHKRAHGHDQVTMSVGFNDESRKLVTLPNGHFDVTVDLENLPEDFPSILHLCPQETFVPSEIGLNADDRRLSIQLSEIDVGGAPVFVASRPDGENTRATRVPAVNVIGYARSEHGVGQSLRQFVSALDAASIPNSVVDFNKNNQTRTEDATLLNRIVPEPLYEINVLHINADQMPEAELSLPSHFLSRYNIGFWHWELPELPADYRGGFSRLNEVWVPSAFVQDAVSKCSPVPVVRMPHAIRFAVTERACRSYFKLPERKFLFLMMYDFSSYQERKNPRAALEAFERAFAKNNDKAALVIKTQNAQFHVADSAALKEQLAGRGDIFWINRTLTRQEVYDLEYVCDGVISLHHSEGYGLVPAEAMFLGKPVIATNWSGNTEFMRPQNSLLVNYKLAPLETDFGVYKAGQIWANPDVEHAAMLMRRIVDDDRLRQSISTEAERTIKAEFSPEAIGQKIRARLDFICDAL